MTGPLAMAQTLIDNDDAFATNVPTTPTLEFRIAEDESAEGLTKAVIAGTDQQIYLHKVAVVTDRHVSSARVNTDFEPVVEVEFNSAGAERLRDATLENKGKRLAVLFNGMVLFAPKIMDTISKSGIIAGISSKEEAYRIADSISRGLFSAYLLLVKPDWSRATGAAGIERQLREVFADVTVPQQQLDQLPASATDILCPPEIACLYTPDNFQHLLSWLTANDLVVEEIPFSVAEQYRRGYGQDHTPIVGGSSSLVSPFEFLDLPLPEETTEHAFVSRKAEFRWDVDLSEQQEHSGVFVSRTLEVMEKTRGQRVGISKGELDASHWEFNLPNGFVVVSNAFPVKTEMRLREGASRNGFDALLVITLENVGTSDEDAAPRLRLPDRVTVLNAGHSPKYVFVMPNDQPTEENSGERTFLRRSPSAPTGAGLSGLGLGDGMGLSQQSKPAVPLTVTRIFRVQGGAAVSSAAMLQQLLAQEEASIVAETSSDSVIVRATPSVMAEVVQVMEALAAAGHESDDAAGISSGNNAASEETPDIPKLRMAYEQQEQSAGYRRPAA